MNQIFKKYLGAFYPNNVLSSQAMLMLILGQALFVLVIWSLFPFSILPTPQSILKVLPSLWFNDGIGQAIITSVWLNIQAIGITVFVSLLLSYLTIFPFFQPIAALVAKGRFFGFVGLTFVFGLITPDAHALKIFLLVFGMSVFYVTSMASVVATIPSAEYDYAKTLRLSKWRIVWEVVILGKLDQAIEIMRQNAAMGWMMLTMVEGLVRSEGGIGGLLLNENKHLNLDKIFAILIVILIIGIIQDFCIGWLKKVICPYLEESEK